MILAHSRGGQGWAGQVMRETKPPPNEDWRLTKIVLDGLLAVKTF